MTTAILAAVVMTGLVRLRRRLAERSRAEQVAHAARVDAEFAAWLRG